MGHHCCSKQKVKRGLWSPEEDEKLIKCITTHGHGCWSSVPKLAGLERCGKSCRLRWINYLRPDLKRGSFSAQEERIIIDVHRILGNRWAQIAKHLPGRTDNEVKNFWNSCIKKKLIAQGLDPKTHNLMISSRHTTLTNNNNNNNSNACNNLNQFYQQPTSVFSINSHMESSIDSNLPNFITFPPPSSPPNVSYPPSLLGSMTIPATTTFDYKNPSLVNDRTYCHALIEFGNQCSVESAPISTSFSMNNPSGFGQFIDEGNCLWGGGSSFEPPKQEEMLQQQEIACDGLDFCETNEALKNCQDMQTSFSGCSDFGLEFMESPLSPCGEYTDINTMGDQLAWD